MSGALDLFPHLSGDVTLGPGAMVLGGFALGRAEALRDAVSDIVQAAPLRHLRTPGGRLMSAAMSNCGDVGWVSDARGYRYEPCDPQTGRAWPAMPAVFAQLAEDAALQAGFADFSPDACLINRYVPGARMTMHQDRDEQDNGQPIVSVSLGLPAVFLWGGAARSDRPRRVRLAHGDVVVWGGPSRLTFHGIDPLKPGTHTARFNLTFRRAR